MLKGALNNKKQLVILLILVFSVIFFIINFRKIITVDAGNESLSLDDLTNELNKHNCVVNQKDAEYLIKTYYITDDNCPFELHYIDFNTFINKYFDEFLEKVENNGADSSSSSLTYQNKLVSKDTCGDYFRLIIRKDNSLLYINTAKENKDLAKEMVENLDYDYTIIIQLKYIVLPGIIFAIGIILLIYDSKNDNKNRERK